MKTLNKFFNNKEVYSRLAIILLCILDCIAVLIMHNVEGPWVTCLYVTIIAIFLLWVIRWGIFHGNPFWTRSKLVTRLMANAIAPSWWGVFYLLVFIIHLGWLTDGSLNLFITNNRTSEVLSSVIVAALGLVVLGEFFPEAKAEKRSVDTKIFVSGISALGSVPPSFDFEKFSMTPIVKILQETKREGEKCKLLILLSDYYTANKLINNKTLEERLDIVKQTIRLADMNLTDEEYNKWSVEEKLTKLIKEVAIHNFSKSEDWINCYLEIEFTKPCNYDDYPTCFNTLSKVTKELDFANNTELCFNLTPGTAPISSIVTLLSIDSKRKLYYYSQDSSIQENQIKPVDKTKVPLENLLSQALETLKEA